MGVQTGLDGAWLASDLLSETFCLFSVRYVFLHILQEIEFYFPLRSSLHFSLASCSDIKRGNSPGGGRVVVTCKLQPSEFMLPTNEVFLEYTWSVLEAGDGTMITLLTRWLGPVALIHQDASDEITGDKEIVLHLAAGTLQANESRDLMRPLRS